MIVVEIAVGLVAVVLFAWFLGALNEFFGGRPGGVG